MARLSIAVLRKFRQPILVIVLAGLLIAVGLVFTYFYNTSPKTIVFHTLAYGLDASGYSQTAYFVINDQTAWSVVWNQAFCPSQPSCSSPPPVDTSQRTVVAVFLGKEYFPQIAMNVTQVTSTNSGTIVDLVISFPGINCVYNGGLRDTFPYHIVDFSNVNGPPMPLVHGPVPVPIVSGPVPVSFTTRTQARNC